MIFRPSNLAKFTLPLLLCSPPALARGRLDPRSGIPQAPDAKIVIPPRESESARFLEPQGESRRIKIRHHRLGKLFWVGWGVAAGLTVANAEMAKHCEHVAGCEVGSLWGTRNPSRLQLYLPSAADIAVGMLFTRRWLHEDPNDKYSKVVIYGVDGILGGTAAVNAFHTLSK